MNKFYSGVALRKLLATSFIVITVLFSNTFSEIISGTNILLYNENITFHSRTITKNTRDSTLHDKGLSNVYKCTADVESIDVFNAVKINATCTFICHILAIGSPRPFYLSKIPFESFDFSDVLNISDTSVFMKIDTLINETIVSNSSNCFLPHVILRSTEYLVAKKYDSVNFGIFKNIDGKFIAAKFDTVMDLSSDGAPEPQMHPYLKGYNIKWFLQNDGSLNFKDITAMQLVSKPFRMPTPILVNNKSFYYDIYGRRVNFTGKQVSQILIKQSNNKVVLVNNYRRSQ